MTDFGNQRPLIYIPNGTGRDQYIYRNNGGFTNYDQRTIVAKPGTFRS